MSCVGAGLQSLTGAPQLLAAMAADETIPFLMPFKATKDEHGNNKVTKAVGMTWAIGALPCLAGNLDFITAPLTMCFLKRFAICPINFDFTISSDRVNHPRPVNLSMT